MIFLDTPEGAQLRASAFGIALNFVFGGGSRASEELFESSLLKPPERVFGGAVFA